MENDDSDNIDVPKPYLKEVKQDYEAKLDGSQQNINELRDQLNNSREEVTKLLETTKKYETEASDCRREKNEAVDERDSLLKMLDRRNVEVERLQADIKTYKQQLQSAINSKCDVLARIDEIQSKKVTLDFKEKRIEHRTANRMKHVDALSRNAVMVVRNSLTDEIMEMQNKDELILTIKKLLETQEYEDYNMKNGVLFKFVAGKDVLVVPTSLQKEIIRQSREKLRETTRENILKIQEEQKQNYKRRRKKARKYKPGDLVAIIRTQFGTGLKLRGKFLGPYVVQKSKGKERYEVKKLGSGEGPYLTTTAADVMKPWTYESSETDVA